MFCAGEHIMNDNFAVGKIEEFQNMGPSSLNIHFGWVGILCFFSHGTEIHGGTIERLNWVGEY